jgi:hypothetical protein
VASRRWVKVRQPAERKLGLLHDLVEVDSPMGYLVGEKAALNRGQRREEQIMTDKPSLGDPATNPSDIKPSLTIRYAALLIVSTVITGSTTFGVTRVWESWSVEKKVLFLTSVSSQNLAATTEGLPDTLEFRLALSPTDKRTIKSLFGYQVAVQNQSQEAVDNLVLHLYPPPNVTLIDPPKIISPDSKILADTVLQSKRISEKEIVFDLDLLGPRQQVTLAYSGYSEDAIVDPSFIDVEMRKKDWVIRKVIDYKYTYDTGTTVTYGNTDIYPDGQGILSILSKPIASYTGEDVIALFLLLVIVTCVSGLLTWLLARLLSGSSKSFHDWRSRIERLFRRAG